MLLIICNVLSWLQGDDSVIDCLNYNTQSGVQMSYNNGRHNEVLFQVSCVCVRVCVCVCVCVLICFIVERFISRKRLV